MQIHIADLEAAINHWRTLQPTMQGGPLPAAVQALAQVYGTLALTRQQGIEETALPPAAHSAWLAWYATTPDTPCIAICSTSQGDDWCKGCGRSFTEVQHWLEMDAVEKRATWQRITREGTAWRFNRYAERAQEQGQQAQLCSA